MRAKARPPQYGAAEATVELSAFGDSALLATLHADTPESAWQAAHQVAEHLRRQPPDGVCEIAPSYDSVLVEYDCSVTTHADLERAVEHASSALLANAPTLSARHFRVPTVYGGEEGPDLDEVAAILGLDPGRVIELHTAAPLRIRCMTFPIASPMLDGPEFPNVVPRRTTPRTTMADGVVMVAGRQSALSPLGAPTGWQIIGRTPCSLVDIGTTQVAPYRSGDWLHFASIEPREWASHLGRPLERIDG